VLVSVADGRISAIDEDVQAPADARRLPGLVIPGLANAHSHAFHRALRGRTQLGRGDFWTWREQMYSVAGGLDPENYLALARATYAEMALAGVTCVGEFHYVHHEPDGRPYSDSNAMGHALIEAAAQVGVRLTLLDTCYVAGGFGQPLAEPQRRFSDGDAAGWAERVGSIDARAPHVQVGAAIHSVRAVPAPQLAVVGEWARAHGVPLHFHLSEQAAENDACLAQHGVTPTRLLADAGVLGAASVAVHATHLATADIGLLGASSTGVCFCPTTERDLADGIGPASALVAAGTPLSLGSDGQTVIDLFEEARGVEHDERLATNIRGTLTAAQLLEAATLGGHRALGWSDAGELAIGMRADLVAVDLESVRTAGCGATAAAVVFAATASDVTDVVVDGVVVVESRQHRDLGDVGVALRDAIASVAQ
jgi:formiminoglutamate deiminase